MLPWKLTVWNPYIAITNAAEVTLIMLSDFSLISAIFTEKEILKDFNAGLRQTDRVQNLSIHS